MLKSMVADRREFLNRSLGLAGLAAGGTLALGTTPALAQGDFVEGKQFIRLSQAQPVSTPVGKIEVLEFFSYGCPHCSAFEPQLHDWVKRLPADVVFRRVPVNFLANYENFQRLYYSLEAMGQVDALQSKIFAAVHVQHDRLANADAIADLVSRHGVDRAKFLSMFNSFGVQTKVKQVPGIVGGFKLDGVPTLAIQGQYVTSPSMVGNEGMSSDALHARALQAVDMLIARVRKVG